MSQKIVIQVTQGISGRLHILILFLLLILIKSNLFAVGIDGTNLKEPVFFTVIFDLNCGGKDTLLSIKVKENGLIKAAPDLNTERAGYRFAGWYTTENPKLVNGVSEEEWIFGNRKMFSFGNSDKNEGPDFMPVTSDMTLYARWVTPVNIYTVEDLQNIKTDLRGWYILQNDIDLKGMEWAPVGVYENSYEFSNANWWKLAFQGQFDGNNHAIKNLTIHKAQNIAALFEAVSNAEIKNLLISNYYIEFELADGGDVVASYVYAAPLIGLMHGNSSVNNCSANGKVNVRIEDTTSDMTFTSAAGLISGAWGGEVSNCNAQGNIIFSSVSNNGGELYVAGLTGEGYNKTKFCTANVNIICEAFSKSAPIQDGDGKDKHLDLYIGGVNGSSTAMTNCFSKGSISVSSKKVKGEANIYVGGISGNHRYGAIEFCRSDCDITVNEGKSVYAGGVLGGFSSQYGMIGYLMGERKFEVVNSLAVGKININQNIEREENGIHFGAIIGEIPKELKADWMPNAKPEANYKAENCAFLDYYEGAVLADTAKTIKGFARLKEMKGDALNSILGEAGWLYKKNKLPIPKSE